jgi:hypothetical protein
MDHLVIASSSLANQFYRCIMQHLKSFLSYKCYSVATIGGTSLMLARIISMPTPVAPKAQKQFDYSSLDSATSQFVQQQTGEIRGLMKRTAQDIVEIGQKLIEVKTRLGYGRFGDWLEAEFEWGEWTARKFMQVAQQFKSVKFTELQIAPSALYELAAPSTPEAARSEALSRAEAGESISYTAAKAIKQKYTPPPKPKPELEPQQESISLPQPTLTPAPPLASRPQQEIVAILPQRQAATLSEATRISSFQTTQAPSVSQLALPEPELPGVWWQLGGKHLLYCGEPNSAEFFKRITEEVPLLLAFPPNQIWQPTMPAAVRLIVADYLPVLHDPNQLDEAVESAILFYSSLRDIVVSCFLPTSEILSILNRLDRWGVVAEPEPKRCNAVISDWKKAGLKVERMS